MLPLRFIFPSNVAGELQAPQNVIADEISRDAGIEDVAEPLIEDQLGRGPRVDAAENGREGELTLAGLVDLSDQVAVLPAAGLESRARVLKELRRVGGQEGVLPPLGLSLQSKRLRRSSQGFSTVRRH